jgi:hypothetical protein
MDQNDILKGILRIRPKAEIGLSDPTGELPRGASTSPYKLTPSRVRTHPGNQNEEMFTPQQPNRANVQTFMTPEQRARLLELGFKDYHLEHMSPEQMIDILAVGY